jgi:hypothetical protein
MPEVEVEVQHSGDEEDFPSMALRLLLGLSTLFYVASPLSAKKEKDVSPQEIVNARYVAVMYLSADGPCCNGVSPRLSSQDGAVLDEVEEQLRKWGRYIVTLDSRHADLIIAVRTAQQTVYTGVGAGRRGGARTEHEDWGADIGPAVDMIRVFSPNPDPGSRQLAGAVLWTAAERNGLAPPDLSLVQRFRKEVEQAAQRKK